jgi:hypothetical protein
VTNSRAKGCRNERACAHELNRLFGTECRRGCQFQGSPDSPDVVGFPLHVECKAVEKLNINEAVEQAVADCGSKIPCVIHKRNRKPWLITMRLDDAPEAAYLMYLASISKTT